jgi:endonuclease/exonuclease/phosphatase family metal-dependent hydrolase
MNAPRARILALTVLAWLGGAALGAAAWADDATVTTYNIRHFLGYGNAGYGGYWGNAPWVLDGSYEKRWYPNPDKWLFIDGRWMSFWEFFTNVLREVASDIIILQEVPTAAQRGPEIVAELARRLGMYQYTMPSSGGTPWHWLAILSRYPIVDVHNYSIERDIRYHGLIRARVRLAAGALLDVFSTHLDSASEFWRQDNLKKILAVMKESPYPHVLGCDMNSPVYSTVYTMMVNAGYRESRRSGIDFVWLSPGSRISELTTAAAVWKRWTGTGEPRGSDHAAVKTTVRVASTAVSPATFSASFSGVSGNEWWVQASVSATRTLAGVDARVNGGSWVALANQGWGWARSVHAPGGSSVQFRARATDGSLAYSAYYAWTSAAFHATFSGADGNEWWVQVSVSANAPLAGVDVSVGGGAWVALTYEGWGWARSVHVPDGSSVRLRARSAGGLSVTTAPYAWPP